MTMAKNKNIMVSEPIESNLPSESENNLEGKIVETNAQADDLLLGAAEPISDEEMNKILQDALKQGKIQPPQYEAFMNLLKKEPELTLKLIETLPNHSPHPDFHSRNPTQNGMPVISQARQVGRSIKTSIATPPQTEQTTKPTTYDTTTVSTERIEQISKEIN